MLHPNTFSIWHLFKRDEVKTRLHLLCTAVRATACGHSAVTIASVDRLTLGHTIIPDWAFQKSACQLSDSQGVTMCLMHRIHPTGECLKLDSKLRLLPSG